LLDLFHHYIEILILIKILPVGAEML